MAHESFENPATAAVMNEVFVNIKTDREERPDIDHLRTSALHALGRVEVHDDLRSRPGRRDPWPQGLDRGRRHLSFRCRIHGG
ncbi:hypothetical protein BOSE62_110558 [Bosea sp. 62]|nr:hypothetical protein BOSE21B_50018 [Bosea sp. 21B]CAD5286198.1 hypothetical protein BOSE46_70018 [Bosea sp. 46]CAD5301824.1 hypothetical protein BOSE7B_90670 [Bosea sp. 7B]VVT51732.1 hypothetical protein BOS5A_110431 [Bosea sp. EC-HK365B]VXB17251.1 hypothetical protein BOSE62_110558 [Bosea sp. 62]VXB78551.1 hypothetical protein BOSE127_140614 [Bosea sp. 127]VXC51854.1 hypothetical protein BOSE29B_50018 [Bosea sp. 29B]VXC87866.1 hypothetical protein BOSE125_70083 [Bosea sp. 125]